MSEGESEEADDDGGLLKRKMPRVRRSKKGGRPARGRRWRCFEKEEECMRLEPKDGFTGTHQRSLYMFLVALRTWG